MARTSNAIGGLFVVEDLHSFCADYDRTVMAWHEKVEKAWPQFSDKLGGAFIG